LYQRTAFIYNKSLQTVYVSFSKLLLLFYNTTKIADFTNIRFWIISGPK